MQNTSQFHQPILLHQWLAHPLFHDSISPNPKAHPLFHDSRFPVKQSGGKRFWRRRRWAWRGKHFKGGVWWATRSQRRERFVSIWSGWTAASSPSWSLLCSVNYISTPIESTTCRTSIPSIPISINSNFRHSSSPAPIANRPSANRRSSSPSPALIRPATAVQRLSLLPSPSLPSSSSRSRHSQFLLFLTGKNGKLSFFTVLSVKQ